MATKTQLKNIRKKARKLVVEQSGGNAWRVRSVPWNRSERWGGKWIENDDELDDIAETGDIFMLEVLTASGDVAGDILFFVPSAERYEELDIVEFVSHELKPLEKLENGKS